MLVKGADDAGRLGDRKPISVSNPASIYQSIILINPTTV